MNFIVYGMNLCPDCMDAKKLLAQNGIPCAYVEITESTANLKAFLRVRDAAENAGIFDAVREKGSIGIPCFVFSDGTVTTDIERAIALAKQ